MNDLIEREKALDGIMKRRWVLQMLDDTHRADLVMNGLREAEIVIEGLPKAEQWIPCSVRQPTKETQYLVTLKDSYGYFEVAIGEWWGDCDDPKEKGWGSYGDEVVAWMPLPKPYKKQRGENESRKGRKNSI